MHQNDLKKIYFLILKKYYFQPRFQTLHEILKFLGTKHPHEPELQGHKWRDKHKHGIWDAHESTFLTAICRKGLCRQLSRKEV